MALTSTISGSITARQTVANDAGTANFPAGFSTAISLADGTIAGKADRLYSDTVTIAASGTLSLDLSGTLLDGFGNAVVFATVKAIYCHAAPGNTNDVIIGNGATPFIGWFGAGTHTITLKPGYFAMIGGSGTGWAVTNATADILKFANSSSGTGVNFDLMIVGTSA